MSEEDVQARLEALEIRYSHQEQVVEELTRNLLHQERALTRQAEIIERLEKALKTMERGGSDVIGDEKPPHY